MTGTATPAAAVRPRGRLSRKRVWVAGAVILGALGFLVVQALGEATVYFKTADEAVAEKAGLGDRRFRIEGLVVAGSVRPAPAGGGVDFEIRGQRGATVDVVHRGDPPQLFQPGIPVVLEGRWSGDHYASDRIMVKHTNEYKAENPARVDDYVGQNP
ncbi:MAG TPA: cytochrome c maturation protein CcmE [Acidimicrobiales bacterium]|nr:cytochrome c maturation protein CcmE [Acidimicrobiales bacterium]